MSLPISAFSGISTETKQVSDDRKLDTKIFTALSSGSFCQIYRVTDEALIAEIAVLPNFFLMNVCFALKESKLFIIIHNDQCSASFVSGKRPAAGKQINKP